MSFLLSRLLMGAALSTVGAGGAVAYNDEGTRRSLQFWKGVMPVYLHYRYTQQRLKGVADDEADQEWDRLHDRYAPQIVDLTLRLKGFYLKQAQLMSTRDDLVPKQYMEAIKPLQDRVPTPFDSVDQVKQTIERSLGRPLDQVFSWFDDAPCGAASIGQVHRARLLSGQPVCVKVQYPDIEQKFRADLTTTLRFCKLAMKQHVPAMQEIERQFLTEFDYYAEAQNQERIRKNLEQPFGDRIRVPKAYLHLCTKEVLVQEYLEGKTLVQGLRDQLDQFARRLGKTREQLELEHRAAADSGAVRLHSLREERWRQLGLRLVLRLMDWVQNAGRLCVNWTVGLVQPQWRRPLQWTAPPLDLGTTLELLNEVHAYELFHDQFFNGDCHPGNLLLCSDGRLGLIDYGQCKQLSDRETYLYARLIRALCRDPGDGSADPQTRQQIVNAFVDMGGKTTNMNPDVLYRLACFWNDRDTDDVTEGLNISNFMDEMERRDPAPLGDWKDGWIVMPARLSVLLRGMGLAFGLRFRTAPLWQREAELCIQRFEQLKGPRHQLNEE